MSDSPQPESGKLRCTLGPVMLWGLGVGYVISGEYFGWNCGLREGGTWWMLIGAKGLFNREAWNHFHEKAKEAHTRTLLNAKLIAEVEHQQSLKNRFGINTPQGLSR